MPDLHRLGNFTVKNALLRFVGEVEGLFSSLRQCVNIYALDDIPKNESEIVISCQLVVYEAGAKTDRYRVYNLCHDLTRYTEEHEKYFGETDKNKSIVSIYCEELAAKRWGFWKPNPAGSERTDQTGEFVLEYREDIADAKYSKFEDENESHAQWDRWSSLMFTIYPYCAGVYSDNFPIRLGPNLELHSAIFLSLSRPLREDDNNKQREKLGQISKRLLIEIARQDLIPGLYRSLEKQATRAAISQVMARNASHNIGSHVLSKFKDEKDLNGLFGIDLREAVGNARVRSGSSLATDPTSSKSDRVATEPQQYDGCAHERSGLYTKLTKGPYKGKSAELTAAAQVSHFNEYLKNRMDFLADIATADPVMENAMFLYSEVFKGFDRNRILLNRISGISDPDFNYRIKFVSDLVYAEGEPLTKINDLQVAMTNDILGAQALYIILENIIRNIAKHAKADGDEKSLIEITVKLSNYAPRPEFYEVSIFDNLKRSEKIQEIVINRNDAFNASILRNEDHAVRSDNLGTIEMDVCAAYLRRIPIIEVENNRFRLIFKGMSEADRAGLHPEESERLDQSSYEPDCEVINRLPKPSQGNSSRPSNTLYPKLMFAYQHDHREGTASNANEKYSLGYMFYVRKPQEVLVIIDGSKEFKIAKGLQPESNLDYQEMPAFGIKVMTAEELEHSLDTNETEVFTHQILYWNSKSEFPKEAWNKYLTRLPKRIVPPLTDSSFQDAGDFTRRVWEKYVADQFLTKRSLKLISSSGISVISGGSGGLTIQATTEETAYDTVFLDNHHFNWCRTCFVEKNPDGCSSIATHTAQPSSWNYYDMVCSHTRLDKYFSAITGSSPTQKLQGVYAGQYISQYVETVRSGVLLLDERIQENIANPKSPRRYARTVDLYDYFQTQGIIIPRLTDDGSSPNLNVSSFGTLDFPEVISDMPQSASEALRIQSFIEEEIPFVRFCVIHLGILEKMVGGKGTKSKTDIKNVLDALFVNVRERIGHEKDKCEVIITSGRGQPTNVPENYSFVPLAPIQNAVETMFDKFLLTRILYNSREITNG